MTFITDLLGWILLNPFKGFILTLATYVIMFSLYYQKKWRWLAYCIAPIFVLMDAAVNMVAMSLVTLDRPKELLVTARLKRYKKEYGKTPSSQLTLVMHWRLLIANRLCQFLNKYDPDHC